MGEQMTLLAEFEAPFRGKPDPIWLVEIYCEPGYTEPEDITIDGVKYSWSDLSDDENQLLDEQINEYFERKQEQSHE